MSESRDLQRIANLLSLQGIGTFTVNAVGTDVLLTARFLRRTLPALEHLVWEREPVIDVVPTRHAAKYLERVPSSILWVRTDTGKEAAKLRNFRPRPAVVIREGASSRYVAFWALLDPLPDLDWLERANRRLAHHLGTKKKYAKDSFTFSLPGAVLREGRSRPVPVELVRFEPEVLRARDVVGKLRDAPDPDAWRNSQDRAPGAFSYR